MAYAHTPNDSGDWHGLVEHLRGVASRASRFAESFDGSRFAECLGLWHDVGKFDPEFQAYLHACASGENTRRFGPDHKAAGARLAVKYLDIGGLLVRGHHGGLKSPSDFRGWLREKIRGTAPDQALELAITAMPDLEPDGPIASPHFVASNPFAADVFLRLLFSALVDADFLDTEAHFNPRNSESRGNPVSIAALWETFQRDKSYEAGQEASSINDLRNAVYDRCVAAADNPPGLFRLAVPTGGGKTRSAMAFALKHAQMHGLDRVIAAVPFISITEQTADVYGGIFKSLESDFPVVLEHHSTPALTDDDDGEFTAGSVHARLAAENWDAPIIVTTTVQLFESLFSNRVSKTRKLHNLARSVIILDEVQALPGHLLTPILDMLQELCAHFGSTVVLSTATQPAFEAIPVFASAHAVDIVPDNSRLFDALRRVEYEWRLDSALGWEDVAGMFKQERQVLCVVNTRPDALKLLDALEDPDAFHLSTFLCGAHRRDVIAQVKRRLDSNERCHLVSTQVIEAGVDVDFPMVLRAMGPLDSIIQSAGRCNREGILDNGRVVVFRPQSGHLPTGQYKTATQLTETVLDQAGFNLHDPATSYDYFRRLFQTIDTDREGIQSIRKALDFQEVDRRFRMIDDDTQSVVITSYGSEAQRQSVGELLTQVRRGPRGRRAHMRRLQPFIVSVRSRELSRLQSMGLLSEAGTGLWEWLGGYHPQVGIGGVQGIDPDSLVV